MATVDVEGLLPSL